MEIRLFLYRCNSHDFNYVAHLHFTLNLNDHLSLKMFLIQQMFLQFSSCKACHYLTNINWQIIRHNVLRNRSNQASWWKLYDDDLQKQNKDINVHTQWRYCKCNQYAHSCLPVWSRMKYRNSLRWTALKCCTGSLGLSGRNLLPLIILWLLTWQQQHFKVSPLSSGISQYLQDRRNINGLLHSFFLNTFILVSMCACSKYIIIHVYPVWVFWYLQFLGGEYNNCVMKYCLP